MKKISVLLVDDEPLVLEDLKDIIDWDAAGFEIVASARNGKQGYAKYIELLPQVVITDINMPIMDGVTLAKELRKLDVQPIIIFLTAYSDFNYAMQAFRYGIDDYLLKNEVKEPLLKELLGKLRERIETLEKTSELLAKETIVNLFNGVPGAGNKNIIESSAILETKYFFCFLEEDSYVPFLVSPALENTSGQIGNIESLCGSLVKSLKISMAVAIDKKRVLLCFEPPKEHSQSLQFSVLTNQANALITELKKINGGSYTAYLISEKMTLNELRVLYYDNIDAFQIKYFLGCGRAYHFLDIAMQDCGDRAMFDFDGFFSLLNQYDEEPVLEYIAQRYDDIIAHLRYDELLNITNIFYLALQNIKERQQSYDSIVDISVEANNKYWLSAQSIKDWMLEKYTFVFQELRKRNKGHLSSTVSRALEYIRCNYSNYNLKIDTIAEDVGISSSRLSILFKNEMNCTVNKYITSFRICKAKILLLEGKHKVYEIASMVGYGSSQYFSQIFYQETGHNPKKFTGKTDNHA